MNRIRCVLVFLVIVTQAASALAQGDALIVVEDLGGTSALPYYRELNLQRRSTRRSSPDSLRPLSPLPRRRYNEADMLPVRSAQLSPGPVANRPIDVPGLTPFFLIGDDKFSRAWMRERLPQLRALRAVGFVVRVDTADALASLRELASGLVLVPASGDDLGQRLGIRHYPVLITATGIEQ